MGSQMLLLNWSEHKSNMIGEFQQQFSRSELTDVTLACEGYILQAHKSVLSASSAFFRSLFLYHPCKHAFVILTDVDSDDLKAIIDFIYQGQIHIPQQKLTQFLKTAEKLKIKGLSAYSQNESPNMKTAADASSSGTALEHNDLSSERQPNRSDDSFQRDANAGSGQLEHTDLSSENQPVRSHLADSFQPNSSSRGEPLEPADASSERHPVRPCQVDSFQTNESHPSQLSLTSRRTMVDSSASYMNLKNESRNMALPIREYCSVSILEPEFSSSLHNITSGSNEISNSQSFVMPVQSVSHETPHWVPQIFPTDKSKSSATFQSKQENHVSGSTTSGSLIEKPRSSSEMEGSSTYVMQIGDPAIEASTSCSKECLKLGGNNSHSYQIAKLTVKAHDKSLFANSVQCCTFQKTFFTKSKLSSHERSSSQIQTYRCTVCNKRFRQKHGLKYHMMAHFGEKPYSCNICDRKFCRPYSLTVHERIHTGEKPFTCAYCGKRFSDKSNFMVHMRSH